MNYYMFFPQNSWIDKFKNKVIVFKQEEKEKIEKYLKYKLPHENVNTIKLKYSSLYNDELKKIVYTFFEEDFENFKYSKKY
jgi:3-oxoacyl-ACP reductase-like protein